ncbi:hypothetical protein PG985_002618 [Apiospora marii]|uniref:Uncharacterized protein n=1 Tax=Apiospora marii TaxID=335849 RepID=A0ABR1RTT1_9PEZI
MAPSLVADCYNDTYCVQMLRGLSSIVYGGGMPPEEIGDVLWQRICLTTHVTGGTSPSAPGSEPPSEMTGTGWAT